MALPPPVEGTISFIEQKFAKRPEIIDANTKAFRAGWNYGETSEDFAVSYEVAPAPLAPAPYRQITGNTALGERPDRRVEALGPAALPRRVPDHAGVVDPRGARRRKEFGVVTFQAEDEIAAVGAAVGARSAAPSA